MVRAQRTLDNHKASWKLPVALAVALLSFTQISHCRPGSIVDPSGSPSVRQSHVDPIAAATGLSGYDLASFKKELADLEPWDKKLVGRSDISAAQAKSLATPRLVIQLLRSNSWITIYLYSNPAVGIYRLSRVSHSLQELLGRPDAAESLISTYAAFNPNPRTHAGYNQEAGPMAFGIMQTLIAYPPLFSRFKGREKELLAALCKQNRAMEKVNDTYPKSQKPYPANDFPVELAFALQHQMGMKLPTGVTIEPSSKQLRIDPSFHESQADLVRHFESLTS